MELDKFGEKRRRAISGIVAALIMFAMLFSVGTGFFIFVNSSNNLYNNALGARNNAQQNRLSESLQITTLRLGNNNIGVYANNTGGIGVNVSALYVQYQGKRATPCMGVGQPNGCSTPSSTTFPSCQFPVFVNVGQGTKGIPLQLGSGCTTTPGVLGACTSTGGSLSSCLDSGQPANSTTAFVRAVTQRGNVFIATYPPSSTTLAAQALSSGAIGDLYLSFQSYTWYTVNYCVGVTPPYCLASQGKGFQVPTSAFSGWFGFSVQVTDFNPQHANITLDKYTLIEHYWPVGASFRTATWYIITNVTNTIASTYAPIVLYYNKPATLVFASSAPGTFTPTNGISSGGPPGSGTLAAVNMVDHGWEAKSFNAIIGPSPPVPNYGQNSPYVSTLYK